MLANKGMVHGDLRSCCIFIDDDGLASFTDPIFLGAQNSSIMKTVRNVTKCPLSPEILSLIRSKDLQSIYSDQSTESWAIGFLLLQMAVLGSEEEYFDWDNYTLNDTLITDSIRQISTRYSPSLTTIIKSCLSVNPSLRPNFSSILEQINNNHYSTLSN